MRIQSAAWLAAVTCSIFNLAAVGADESSERTIHSSAARGEVESTSPQAAAGATFERPRERLSPLHAWLGIDPETGAFTPPSRSPATGSAPSASRAHEPPAAAQSAVAPRRPSVLPDVRLSPDVHPLSDSLSMTPEELMATLDAVLDDPGNDSVRELTGLLPAYLQVENIENLRWQTTLLVALILLLYPAGILISEFVAWWMRRRDVTLLESERRYQRVRMRRRLLMATQLAALGILLSVGAHFYPWWEDVSRAVTFWGVVALVSLWAWSLSKMIKYTAARHEQAVVRELRRYQLEMRQELDELRRQLASMRLSV